MVDVRQATPADQEALFAFIRQAYEGRWQYKIPDRWAWLYVDNPFLEGSALPIWIAVTEGGEVVGQTCAMIEPIKIGTRHTRVGWSVDTFVLPAYRGQGIGYRLQEANDRANPLFMSMFMSAANRRIKESLGSIALDPVAFLDRPMRYLPEHVLDALAGRLPLGQRARSLAVSILRRLGLGQLLGRALTARAARRDEALASALPEGLVFQAVDRFGEEADQLWALLGPHFEAIVVRDQAYLNWKYVAQPHVTYQRYVARRHGELCGYVIFRTGQPPEPEVGILTDFLADPEDPETIRALAVFAIQQLRRAGVRYLITGTSVRAYQNVLVELGFRKQHELVPMAHCELAPPACQVIDQTGAWFLGRGDHDWDQYPNAR